MSGDPTNGYAEVNGLSMYYEAHGEGEPLILLHGGIGAIVAGDADSIPPAHAAEFFGLLGGGRQDGSWDYSGMTPHRLAILPGATHYDIFSSPALAPAVTPFLDASVPGADG